MDNEILNDIIKYATQKLNNAYGYCGVAVGGKKAMLNSDDGEHEITIKLELEESE